MSWMIPSTEIFDYIGGPTSIAQKLGCHIIHERYEKVVCFFFFNSGSALYMK